MILGIDTSSRATSLALVEYASDGDPAESTVRAAFHQEHDHPPSDAVFPILQGLLHEAGLQPDDIDRYAVCVGPGSFTGLRIGLGMAKALAWSLGRPVQGFDAVEVLATRALRQDLVAEGETFETLFTAMRGSAFRGRYRREGRTLRGIDGPTHHDSVLLALADRDPHEALIVGAAEELPEGIAGDVRRPSDEPSVARIVADLAAAGAAAGHAGPLDEVQPRYLKPFSIGKKASTRKDLGS